MNLVCLQTRKPYRQSGSPNIVRAVNICGGRPTFKYTRIEVAGALDRLASGETMESIVAGYGGRVPIEALEEAISIVARYFFSNLSDLAAA